MASQTPTGSRDSWLSNEAIVSYSSMYLLPTTSTLFPAWEQKRGLKGVKWLNEWEKRERREKLREEEGRGFEEGLEERRVEQTACRSQGPDSLLWSLVLNLIQVSSSKDIVCSTSLAKNTIFCLGAMSVFIKERLIVVVLLFLNSDLDWNCKKGTLEEKLDIEHRLLVIYNLEALKRHEKLYWNQLLVIII